MEVDHASTEPPTVQLQRSAAAEYHSKLREQVYMFVMFKEKLKRKKRASRVQVQSLMARAQVQS